MRQAEKEIKKFLTRIPLILDPGEKIAKKKTAKKFKKLKNNFPVLVLAKTALDWMRQAKKEIKEC